MTAAHVLPVDQPALGELVDTVVSPGTVEPMGAYAFGSDAPAAELARHVERTVFLEAFGNTPELLAEEYGPYEPRSIFFCVVDHRRRRPAGVMRIIVPAADGTGLKSVRDIEPVWGESGGVMFLRHGARLDADATWDIATLAVSPEYRGAAATGLVSMGLYQSVVRTALRCGVDWLVAILDLTVYRMATWKFHHPFVRAAADRTYLGSPASLPVFMQISEWQRRVAAADPIMEDLLCRGVGLEVAVRPLDVDAARGLALAVPRA